jgi:hypothetical protein
MKVMRKYIVKIGEQIIRECESYLEAEAHAEFLINMGDEEMIEVEEVVR